jgi:hypothetical protein
MKKRFNYLFAGDPNTTMPEYLGREGQVVEATPMDPAEYDEPCGPMFEVVFPDGFEGQAFADELTDIEE